MAPTKKGRPGRGYETIHVLVRFPAPMLERIAAYQAKVASADWRLTSRHDVILMLCERGLQAVEAGPAPFSPPTATRTPARKNKTEHSRHAVSAQADEGHPGPSRLSEPAPSEGCPPFDHAKSLLGKL